MSEIDEIRATHVAEGDPSDPHCGMCSSSDYPIWPCDAAILLALVDSQHEIMDSQARVSEQHRARGKALAADNAALTARLAAAEAERDAARAWSARWKAVSTRLWKGVHRNLDINERLAKRMLAAEAERDSLKRTLAMATDVAVLVGGVALKARQLEEQRDAAYAERDELIHHKDTRDCTRYGHGWRDAFGPDGALCQCGGMVFAVWASEIRASTEWERAHPSDVRVIENPERSARAREMEDEAEEAAWAAASSAGAISDDGREGR